MRNNPNQGMKNAMILVFAILMIVLGYGSSMMRGASYGMGREAAHSLWSR